MSACQMEIDGVSESSPQDHLAYLDSRGYVVGTPDQALERLAAFVDVAGGCNSCTSRPTFPLCRTARPFCAPRERATADLPPA